MDEDGPQRLSERDREILQRVSQAALEEEPSSAGAFDARKRKEAAVNVAIFSGLRRPFPPGWTKETVIAIFGGGDLDLSSSPPGPDPRLTAVAILSGIKILVVPGTRVSVSGFGLFGGREVKVSQRGDGPEVKMSLWAFLGGIEVKETEPKATD